LSDTLDIAYRALEEGAEDESAVSRRRLIASAGAGLGTLGVFGLLGNDQAIAAMRKNDAQTILNIAATAEVLATIVNTVGPEKVKLDKVAKSNIRAAAREELIHYNVLRSVGARELTKKIWIPDAVFASRKSLLTTLEVGDQIFINAYLIGTTAFAAAGKSQFARFTGEFMGAEAVHRALARQSLGKLGNDRAFMKYDFTNINKAVAALQRNGFGFGKKGGGKGDFYYFDQVKKRTPNPKGVNTRTPR
jgi:hypothetical protein